MKPPHTQGRILGNVTINIDKVKEGCIFTVLLDRKVIHQSEAFLHQKEAERSGRMWAKKNNYKVVAVNIPHIEQGTNLTSDK